MVARTTQARAAVHAALGDPLRLAIVDELVRSDRSPSELGARLGLRSNLLAHHLNVLEDAGLISRTDSSGDGRRRYVALRAEALDSLRTTDPAPPVHVLFVCTHNSARSPLAEAIWRERTGRTAASAGTHPATAIHPLAVDAGRRAGVDLSGVRPRLLDGELLDAADLVVTVCDRAREELPPPRASIHWSIADPSRSASPEQFDEVVRELHRRVERLAA